MSRLRFRCIVFRLDCQLSIAFYNVRVVTAIVQVSTLLYFNTDEVQDMTPFQLRVLW